MGRLIDADVVEKALREYADDVGCKRGEYEMANGILKAVGYIRHNIPTAYDVDKVVEELEDYAEGNPCDRFTGCPYYDDSDISCEQCGALGAIDIVKRGGVE